MTGIGAYLNGGRWNLPGQHVVYTAGSRSLAILEMLVHLDLRRHVPSDRIMVKIEVPDQQLIHSFDVTKLNSDWRRFPYSLETQQVWQKEDPENIAILEIPSAIVPQEHNYLINPFHSSIQHIRVVEVQPLDIDSRLY